MFSLASVQPQIVVPPLATIWNTVRTLSQSNAINRPKGRTTSVAVNTSSEEPIPVTVVRESVEETLRLLGLSEYSAKLSVEELNPLVSSVTEDHWGTQTVSSASFYENKNGFPQEHLQEKRGTHAFHTQSFRITLPNLAFDLHRDRLAQQIFHQTSRGFKTDRSNTAAGFGKSGKAGSSRFKDLKDSMFEIMQPGAAAAKDGKQKPSDRLLGLLDQSSPESQEKLKIAFAEGYVAHGAKAETSPSLRSLGLRILKITLTLMMLWFIIQWLLPFPGLGGDIKLSVLKGEKYEIHPEEISVTFADVKGVEEAKQELMDVVQFLKEPEKFRALGAKLPAGVLLVGPPGNGKTLLARAVAGEAGVPFFHASGSEFDEIFVGTGAKRVRQLFEAAKARAPCLVFIDEIDTVGAKRTSSQIHPYANQTINQLLSEMDGFTQNEGVIVLGATNRRDHLDKALLRPGRFDVEVRVFPPDLKGRMEIIKYYLKNIKIGDDIDIEKIARGTTGCSGADLENLVNQSALKAAMDGASKVCMEDIEFARDKILMGPAKKTKIQDNDTNLCTAYHEAGHALVAYYTKDSTPLHKVTIVPRGMTLGHTSFMPEKEQYNSTKSQLLAQMDVSMGGRVGEELTFGGDKITTGAGSDFQGATAIANAMVKQYGMSSKVGVRVFDDSTTDTGLSFVSVNSTSPATQETIDSEIDKLLQDSYERAKNILKTHSGELKALADALMKYETLDADEMKTVIQGKKLNKSIVLASSTVKPLAGSGKSTAPGSGTAKSPL